jgi:serine phosphatase RsbU (regulator of sigma subunit)
MNTHDVLSSSQGAFCRARIRAVTSAVTFSIASRRATDATIRGGDVFEAVVRPDGSSSVLIADISSKGTPSIAHADTLRHAFRRAAHETNSPGRILSALDALRFEAMSRSFSAIFTTAFVAEIDFSDPQLRYASAGHEPALVITGRSHRHLRVTGPLLGVLDGARHDECREPFEHGALLVVATDGFSECRNTALDSMQFGTAGIVRALAYDTQRTTRSAAQIVARGADIFTGGWYHDDATVAVISRRA